MTWLFFRFYIGVLGVLFLAWYIHGTVVEYRMASDTSRVVLEAHAGGARLIASQLSVVPIEDRPVRLTELSEEFDYPVAIQSREAAPPEVLDKLTTQDVAHSETDQRHFVIATLDGTDELLWLGPFPTYRQAEVEHAIGGWMRVAAEQYDRAPDGQAKEKVLATMRKQFEIDIQIVDVAAVPPYATNRVADGETVFYEMAPPGSEQYYSVIALQGENRNMRFGPFPSFQRIERNAATTTLSLVLLPAAIAIALLLRPVAVQFRYIEDAAKSITGGDLDARIDESKMTTARPLASSFNVMAERISTLFRSQKELLQAVSHELRTPLARIRFAAHLIATAKSDEERAERLLAVDDATQQLDDLVSELLTYVRADSGMTLRETEDFSVREALGELVDSNRPLDDARSVRLLASEDEVMIHGDRGGLLRAVGNLVRNAIHHAKDEVEVSLERSGSIVTIRVDDDGEGIPEAERAGIFQPFVSYDEHGCGLGLALVERIIKAQGGDVRAADSPLGGARFEIIMPVELITSSPTGQGVG